MSAQMCLPKAYQILHNTLPRWLLKCAYLFTSSWISARPSAEALSSMASSESSIPYRVAWGVGSDAMNACGSSKTKGWHVNKLHRADSAVAGC